MNRIYIGQLAKLAVIAAMITSCAQPASALQATAPFSKHVPAADGELGSTAALNLGSKPSEPTYEIPEYSVVAVGESTPALKHRFWLPRHELQAGSAQLHFSRALLMWSSFPESWRGNVQSWSDDKTPSATELKETVEALSSVYEELHLLAISEDTEWDHRLRDKRGPAVYEYLLPDVQMSRDLARLLLHRIDYQLATDDVDGAVESLRDGFRLAAFIGQGETLVQQLVAHAIQNIMLEKVVDLIQIDGGPNLYWPLATLPRPISNLNQSIQFELNLLHRILPVLKEAETRDFPEQYWNDAWAKMIRDLETLGGDRSLKVALAVVGVSAAEPAKKRLLAGGLDAELVASMPPMRAVILDASREIRRISDNLAKANYLPQRLGANVLEKEDEAFSRWTQDNIFKSGAAPILSLLVPAVQAASAAGIRSEYLVNRLMTIEALRMHAANHGGALPSTLDELSPVPALPNPFQNQPFDYRVEVIAGVQVVTLSADVPASAEFLRTCKIRFKQ